MAHLTAHSEPLQRAGAPHASREGLPQAHQSGQYHEPCIRTMESAAHRQHQYRSCSYQCWPAAQLTQVMAEGNPFCVHPPCTHRRALAASCAWASAAPPRITPSAPRSPTSQTETEPKPKLGRLGGASTTRRQRVDAGSAAAERAHCRCRSCASRSGL